MKIYLASRYSSKPEMEDHARELRSHGIEVTSRWLEEPHSPNSQIGDVSEELMRGYARLDIEDIEAAHVLVFFSVDPTTPTVRGGRHVEFGYAMALDKTILVVGPKENIFHFLPSVHFVTNWVQALNKLLEWNWHE